MYVHRHPYLAVRIIKKTLNVSQNTEWILATLLGSLQVPDHSGRSKLRHIILLQTSVYGEKNGFYLGKHTANP